MRTVLFFSTLILLIGLYACSEQEFSEQFSSETSLKNNFEKQLGSSCFENSNNPYEEYGIMHNEKLYSFYEQTIKVGDLRIDHLRNSLKLHGVNIFEGDKSFKLASMGRITYLDYVDQLPIANIEVKNSILEIIRLVDSSRGFSDFAMAMYMFNSKVLSNQLLNERDKQYILIGSSIAVHSYCYWDSEGDKWNLEKASKWLKDTVKADFIGGVGNMILTGLMGGPVGLGTVAAGAFTGSAATALFHGVWWVGEQIYDNW